MVSKLTASGKQTFRAILGHKRTDRRYQLPTAQPTKPQSRKTAHRGESQSHSFLSGVLNRCQTPGGNECLVSWNMCRKQHAPSRPPLATVPTPTTPVPGQGKSPGKSVTAAVTQRCARITARSLFPPEIISILYTAESRADGQFLNEILFK